MPQILNLHGFTLYFFSNEHLPIHVHIKYQDAEVVVVLDTFAIRNNKGFKEHEITKIIKLVKMYELVIRAKWQLHFEENKNE